MERMLAVRPSARNIVQESPGGVSDSARLEATRSATDLNRDFIVDLYAAPLPASLSAQKRQ
jgi:hypothetical protein